MHKEFSQSAKRRGVKNFLLKSGLKMFEMKEFLKGFLLKYGHTNVEDKTLDQLMDKGALFFKSLKKYTNDKLNK